MKHYFEIVALALVVIIADKVIGISSGIVGAKAK
jgi:hypothetical protein